MLIYLSKFSALEPLFRGLHWDSFLGCYQGATGEALSPTWTWYCSTPLCIPLPAPWVHKKAGAFCLGFLGSVLIPLSSDPCLVPFHGGNGTLGSWHLSPLPFACTVRHRKWMVLTAAFKLAPCPPWPPNTWQLTQSCLLWTIPIVAFYHLGKELPPGSMHVHMLVCNIHPLLYLTNIYWHLCARHRGQGYDGLGVQFLTRQKKGPCL